MSVAARLQHSANGGATFAAVDPFDDMGVEGYPTVQYVGVRMLREDENTVFWFGRFEFQLLVTFVNLRRSVDGGANWATRLPTGAVSTDIITSLRCSVLTAGLLWAYNQTKDDLYKDDSADGVANWSTLDAAMDFDLGDLLPTIDDDTDFRIGNLITGATLAEHSDDEAASWTDITGDLAPPETTDGVAKLLIPRQV